MSFLYCGCAICAVDAEGIVAIPEALAEDFGLNAATELLLSPHESDHCLVGFARDHLSEVHSHAERWRLADESAGRGAQAHHRRARQLFGIVEPARRVDGGLQIPATMRHLGQIGRSAVVVGAGERFEIWDADLALTSGDAEFRELVAYRLKLQRRRPPRGGTRRPRPSHDGRR